MIQSALSDIKESIDVLLSLRFPSGNFPSSYGNTSDRLVQWCHGSPGAVDALTRAYEVLILSNINNFLRTSSSFAHSVIHYLRRHLHDIGFK